MLEKLKLVLKVLRLYREAKGADIGAEKAGAKRALKALLLSVPSALLVLVSSEPCVLGPEVCKILADGQIKAILVAGLTAATMGLDKYLNEKFGLGVQALDTVNRDG